MCASKLQIEAFKPPKPSKYLTIKKKRTYKKACDHCHRKHLSCSGKRPCEACIKKGVECIDFARKKYSSSSEDTPSKKVKSKNAVEKLKLPKIGVAKDKNVIDSLEVNNVTYENKLQTENNNELEHQPLYKQDSIYSEEHYSQKESSNSPFVEPQIQKIQKEYDNGSEQVFNNHTTRTENNKFEYGHVYDRAEEVFTDEISSSGTSFSSYRSSSATKNDTNTRMAGIPIMAMNDYSYQQINYQKKMIRKQRKRERLEVCKYLGPKGFELMFQTDVDLLHQHFPLIPLDDSNEANFNKESFYYQEEDEASKKNDESNKSENGFMNYSTVNLDKKECIPDFLERDKDGNQKRGKSFILELDQSDKSHIVANSEWTHSLQYTKPSDIYSKITQPFLHTHGFTALLEYIKKRFHKKDVIKICYDIAAIRPVFIASCINFQEEDMIFMEHCFQRTLLEYASFINEVGNPTIVWRRTGQISYVNDEFLMLTGWTRQQLLGKMTFVIEILDDESSLVFFKNFKAVCYSDYTGFVNVPTMRLLTPQKGKYIDCSSFFIVKRDTFGLPTFTVGNFLPK
ncbi:hypothetical protein ACO0R3_003693 [Hanseniaspora guilliermondii]